MRVMEKLNEGHGERKQQEEVKVGEEGERQRVRERGRERA